jgi:hypothetical protein
MCDSRVDCNAIWTDGVCHCFRAMTKKAKQEANNKQMASKIHIVSK